MDTERNQALRAAGKPPVHPIVRPRTVIYAAILLVIASVMLFGLGARASVDVNILPERNPLYVTLSNGAIRNGYTVKIMNKSHAPRLYELRIEGLDGATLSVVGQDAGGADQAQFSARPDAVTAYRVYVTAPPAAVGEASQPLTMALTDLPDGPTVHHETVFRGPER